MSDALRSLFNHTQSHQLLASAVLLIGILLLRWSLLRTVTRAPIKSSDLRRRWIVQIRNACFFAITMGLVVIWAAELRTAALSVVAVFAAIVLATKELLQCVIGGFVKITSGAFALGDRIEVSGVRGDVIDQTLLTTKIMEIGPGAHTHQGTSRAVTIPNSLFLTTPVFNESFTDKYALHTFTVPIAVDGDWRRAEQTLLRAANNACRPYLEEARRHIAHLTTREGLDTPSVDPRVTLTLPEPGRIDLIVRVPAPSQKKGRIEQQVLHQYLTEMPSAAKAKI